MIEIFKTYAEEKVLVKLEEIERGCWINLTAPTIDEINYVQSKLGICPNFLRDPLDEEEKPRIDVEDDQTLVIVDIPYVYEDDKSLKFMTIPLGIIILEEHVVTICLRENYILDLFKTKKVREFYTFKKTRFTFQILFMAAKEYLKYLRHIDKKTDDAEKSLRRSMKNKELFRLLELEKSLVFFTTSLKSNEIVMEKVLRGKYLRMYDEDQDLLEDVIIENKQAIEMANIYSTILSGMMEAFSSIISNNLNIIMKFLTSITIVMAIPNMVYSFFGINVTIPWGNTPYGFIYVFILSMVISIAVSVVLYRKGMFRG